VIINAEIIQFASSDVANTGQDVIVFLLAQVETIWSIRRPQPTYNINGEPSKIGNPKLLQGRRSVSQFH